MQMTITNPQEKYLTALVRGFGFSARIGMAGEVGLAQDRSRNANRAGETSAAGEVRGEWR
jgi:hypothetical protein